MDPIGLALENFDGAGQQRLYENGELIDTSGEINGIAFTDSAGLGDALRDDPAAPACLVRRVYTYAAGRPIQRSERQLLNHFEDEFAGEGYRLRELIREVATSDALYAIGQPRLRTAQLGPEEVSP
jgi:hypothetical protein